VGSMSSSMGCVYFNKAGNLSPKQLYATKHSDMQGTSLRSVTI